jgi:glucuronate isomerase
MKNKTWQNQKTCQGKGEHYIFRAMTAICDLFQSQWFSRVFAAEREQANIYNQPASKYL